MDKVLSARVDVAVLTQMDRVVRRFGMKKKAFLESAIQLRVHQLEAESKIDVWDETQGAWARNESIETTVKRGKMAFRHAFQRHER